MSGKVAIFGIDGGTLSLIEQWQDELPTFKMFMENGAYGNMMSTVPALTCPAWISMFTGKNPGKLGIYDFLSLSLNNGHARVISSLDYDNALWEILSNHGKTVGMLNIPITYPPHKVNGYLVSGLGTPESPSTIYTYPSSLKDAINRVAGGYKIIPNVLITLYGQEEKCLASVKEVFDKRVKAARYLIDNYPTDVFICVFFVTDIIQHYFWRYMDKSHPRYASSPYGNVVKDTYKQVDSTLGELMGHFPQDTNFILVSDHGFGMCYGGLSINRWLERQGYLKYRRGSGKMSRIYRMRDIAMSHTSQTVVDVIRRCAPRSIVNKLTTSGQAKDMVQNLMANLDWAETKAYVPGASGGGIFINVKGRQPFGVVNMGREYEAVRECIMDDLSDFGLKAYKREELYWGERVLLAPDVAIELGSNGYYPITLDRGSVLIKYAASGAHKPEGLFMAHGSGIKNVGKLPTMSIYDVTPTVLHMMGVTVPNDVDGAVLRGILA